MYLKHAFGVTGKVSKLLWAVEAKNAKIRNEEPSRVKQTNDRLEGQERAYLNMPPHYKCVVNLAI